MNKFRLLHFWLTICVNVPFTFGLHFGFSTPPKYFKMPDTFSDEFVKIFLTRERKKGLKVLSYAAMLSRVKQERVGLGNQTRFQIPTESKMQVPGLLSQTANFDRGSHIVPSVNNGSNRHYVWINELCMNKQNKKYALLVCLAVSFYLIFLNYRLIFTYHKCNKTLSLS